MTLSYSDHTEDSCKNILKGKTNVHRDKHVEKVTVTTVQDIFKLFLQSVKQLEEH